jgi:DNA-binding transcriptional ArsR family regulator
LHQRSTAIPGAETASTLFSPARLRILEQLGEPDTAAGVARRLQLPRQKVGYHMRELEQAGLLELVEERRQDNCLGRADGARPGDGFRLRAADGELLEGVVRHFNPENCFCPEFPERHGAMLSLFCAKCTEASMITITRLLYDRPAAEAEALQDRWRGLLDRLFGQSAAAWAGKCKMGRSKMVILPPTRDPQQPAPATACGRFSGSPDALARRPATRFSVAKKLAPNRWDVVCENSRGAVSVPHVRFQFRRDHAAS